MPPAVSYSTLVPLNTTTANILTDTPLAIAPGNGFYRVIGRHSVVGAENLVLNAHRGSNQAAYNLPMQHLAGGPNRTDDLICEFGVAKGDPIIMTLTENGGVNATPQVRTEFFPVGSQA